MAVVPMKSRCVLPGTRPPGTVQSWIASGVQDVGGLAMSDENPLDLSAMMSPRKGLDTSAPIEIITPAFRGVAQNFFSLPTFYFLDLKAAQNHKTGDELLILFDAAEQAFTEHDMNRLEDLALTDFIAVMHAWVNASGTSAVQ